MGIGEQPDIIDSFEKLGLSPNEAKVYLALLENHPITGYQLSKTSGILRPVVYEMLNRLVEKGGARIIKSNPDTYIPVEIDEFLKNIESDFTEAKRNITKTLRDFLIQDNTDYFWNIIGRKNIINSAIKMISNAKKDIYMSVQTQENLDYFIEALEERFEKGIHIDMFSYYRLETRGVTLYSFKLDPTVNMEEVPKDHVTLCIDGLESTLMNMNDEKNAKSVYSKNESLVSQVRNGVIHSIYQYRLWTYLGTDKLKALIFDEDRKLLERIDKYLAISN
ncbi:MAG: helix-turn-helix domain-containing protein [Brevinematales bacterium]